MSCTRSHGQTLLNMTRNRPKLECKCPECSSDGRTGIWQPKTTYYNHQARIRNTVSLQAPVAVQAIALPIESNSSELNLNNLLSTQCEFSGLQCDPVEEVEPVVHDYVETESNDCLIEPAAESSQMWTEAQRSAELQALRAYAQEVENYQAHIATKAKTVLYTGSQLTVIDCIQQLLKTCERSTTTLKEDMFTLMQKMLPMGHNLQSYYKSIKQLAYFHGIEAQCQRIKFCTNECEIFLTEEQHQTRQEQRAQAFSCAFCHSKKFKTFFRWPLRELIKDLFRNEANIPLLDWPLKVKKGWEEEKNNKQKNKQKETNARLHPLLFRTFKTHWVGRNTFSIPPLRLI